MSDSIVYSLKRSKVKENQHFFISKHNKTPKTNTLLVQSSPSNSNDLGSGKIRILMLIIRIHGFINYSDLFRIGSEPDSIPKQKYDSIQNKYLLLKNTMQNTMQNTTQNTTLNTMQNTPQNTPQNLSLIHI